MAKNESDYPDDFPPPFGRQPLTTEEHFDQHVDACYERSKKCCGFNPCGHSPCWSPFMCKQTGKELQECDICQRMTCKDCIDEDYGWRLHCTDEYRKEQEEEYAG